MFVTVWRLSLLMLIIGVLLLFGGIFTTFALSLVGLVLIGLWVAVWFAGIYLATRSRGIARWCSSRHGSRCSMRSRRRSACDRIAPTVN